MVARSCTLLIFIALENTKARKDLQVLKKNFSSCSPSSVWGSFLWAWFETQGGRRSSGVFVRSRAFSPWQWRICFRGCPALSPDERELLTEPQDRGGTRAPQDHMQHCTSADLGFHFGALGLWEVFCLYVPCEFSLGVGLGLGICPGFCPRCQWHQLFSACCRFCCLLCIYELVLSVLYFSP